MLAKDVRLNLVFATFLLAAGPSSSIGLDNQNVFATKNKKSNESLQGIGQSTTTAQASDCFSELGDSIASCNNLAFSLNLNDGNNAAGQQ
ncbi:MAG: hypothetical protein L0H53_16770 [Candidatus Nitrosocosmicus sp.]|nr:hypothetical protein [Candidatus Nitrosocosmicus sp.]MDN5869040.1 hypothetical protein [Candidatus Nitrosocosmicus sp.]